MTSNQYLKAVLDEQTFSNDEPEMDDLRERRDAIKSLLETEFSDSKPSIRWAGSKAKGTIIKASYDGDMTCYFDRETDNDAGGTLQEIYDDVESALTDDYSIERKTSALRIRDKADWNSDLHIDVVPGRYTDDDRDDVFLYQADGEKSRLKTNLQTHIDYIRTSGVRAAIRLLKFWRTLNGIDSAKTFVLELLIVKLLDGKEDDALETQLTHVLTEFRDNSANLAVEDPANSNNDLKPALDMCRGVLATVASNTLWQVLNNGWEAVFGALESDAEKKSQALKSATVVTASRTRPWSN